MKKLTLDFHFINVTNYARSCILALAKETIVGISEVAAITDTVFERMITIIKNKATELGHFDTICDYDKSTLAMKFKITTNAEEEHETVSVDVLDDTEAFLKGLTELTHRYGIKVRDRADITETGPLYGDIGKLEYHCGNKAYFIKK